MKTNYFKSSILLLLFLPALTLTLFAQQNSIEVTGQLKGMALSEKEGVLSKINANSINLNQKDAAPFYVNALPDKRHGLTNNTHLYARSSDYEYNEHNYL